ncbi:hypothetical protein [Ktedonobacter robiniae]|uniref:hypothetical protein n=1 Tax=Ktedonobacter robiniae TaxID=2778365 RepID=UPI0019152C78|nr:hypothetical protein [Ktedonobacter robiniae]
MKSTRQFRVLLFCAGRGMGAGESGAVLSANPDSGIVSASDGMVGRTAPGTGWSALVLARGGGGNAADGEKAPLAFPGSVAWSDRSDIRGFGAGRSGEEEAGWGGATRLWLAARRATAKSSTRAKRSWGCLERALNTTSST